MLVRHFMTRDIVALEESERCVDAYELFRAKRMRRAPVVRDGRVVGMISDRDLLRALPWSLAEKKEVDASRDLSHTVGEYMARNIVSVTPRTHLEDVARLMLEHKIGGLPVIDDGKLVGIITESDIFRIFVRMSLQAHGTRITLQAPGGAEEGPDPLEACRDPGQHLSGLARYTSPAGTTMMTLHVTGPGSEGLPERLRDMGFVLIDVQRPGREEA